MSRDIREKKVTLADDLWSWVDDLSSNIDKWSDDVIAKDSEHYKLVLMGRKEMLDMVMDWLKDNEIEIAELLKTHGYRAYTIPAGCGDD